MIGRDPEGRAGFFERMPVDARIQELSRAKPRFASEAYEFICDAVTFTMKRLGRDEVDPEEVVEDHHVSGSELLRGVCDMAIQQFGLMAPVVFKQWGILTTDHVGQIVFRLIDAKCLSKSERDSPEDFHELFDLHRVLAEGFALTLDDSQTAKRSER